MSSTFSSELLTLSEVEFWFAQSASLHMSVHLRPFATDWLSGPAFLLKNKNAPDEAEAPLKLFHPELDTEMHLKVAPLTTTVSNRALGTCFERFSKWDSLFKAVANFRHIAHSYAKSKENSSCTGWHSQKKT